MELIMTVWTWFVSHIDVVLQVIGAFAVLATLTKNTADDAIVNGLLKVVNFLGGNLGNAANKDDSELTDEDFEAELEAAINAKLEAEDSA